MVDMGVWQDLRCTVGRCFYEMSLCMPDGWLVLYKSLSIIEVGSDSDCHSRREKKHRSLHILLVCQLKTRLVTFITLIVMFLMSTLLHYEILEGRDCVFSPLWQWLAHGRHSYLLTESLNGSLNSSGPGYPCIWLCL